MFQTAAHTPVFRRYSFSSRNRHAQAQSGSVISGKQLTASHPIRSSITRAKEAYSFSPTGLHGCNGNAELQRIARSAALRPAVGQRGETKREGLFQPVESRPFGQTEKRFDTAGFRLGETPPHRTVVRHRLVHAPSAFDGLKPHAVERQQVAGIDPHQFFELFLSQFFQTHRFHKGIVSVGTKITISRQ